MATSEVLKTGDGGGPVDRERGTERGPKGHRWLWFVLLVLIAGGVIAYTVRSRSMAGTTSTQRPGGPAGPGGSAVVSVGCAAVLKQDVPFYLTGLGSVTAFYTVTVHSRVDGQIMKVYFQEGQFVQAGDQLIDI